MYSLTNKDGKEQTRYETPAEVSEIAHDPPWYCEKDGTKLVYHSFYDSIGRFTLKAYCPTCKKDQAISIKKEKYEEHMLRRWSQLVKERALNRCEMADECCAGPLHAHHIIPKHMDPGKKYVVENGMCLCEAHHKMIHSYM